MATTARDRALAISPEPPRLGLPWLLSAPAALVFGPEDRGLSNTELDYAQRYLRIPTSPAYPSLNLAQAVAVCCYELAQLVQEPGAITQASGIREQQPLPALVPELVSEGDAETAPFEALEAYYQQLETVLLKIGYLYPHTAASRMAKFRRLFNRAQLSNSEVAMLRGILAQVKWAIQSKNHLQ